MAMSFREMFRAGGQAGQGPIGEPERRRSALLNALTGYPPEPRGPQSLVQALRSGRRPEPAPSVMDLLTQPGLSRPAQGGRYEWPTEGVSQAALSLGGGQRSNPAEPYGSRNTVPPFNLGHPNPPHPADLVQPKSFQTAALPADSGRDPRWGDRGGLGEGGFRGGAALADALVRAARPETGRLRPAHPAGLRGPIRPPLVDAAQPTRPSAPTPPVTRAPAKGSPHTFWPVPGYTALNEKDTPEEGRGYFGARRTKDGRVYPHRGIDVQAPEGTPLKASRDGTIVHAGPLGRAGQLVIIRHADGSRTRYAHLQPDGLPKVGAKVAAGTQIGRVGRTGNVPEDADAHLHYEIIGPDGVRVDPERYFPRGDRG